MVDKNNLTPINVGVLHSPPFCFKVENEYKGICIELWEMIAERLNYKSNYVEFENTDKAIQKVADKQIDILIGSISINHKRVQLVKFTRPFYMNRFAIATKNVSRKFRILLRFLRNIGIGLLGFLGISVILNFFFVRAELGKVKSTRKKWITSYWQFAIGFLQGEVDVSPKTNTGRFIIILTILLGVIFFSFITASVIGDFFTSSFQTIRGSNNIRGKKLIAKKGTVNVDIGKKYGALMTETEQHPLDFYMNNINSYYGVIDDEPILQYLISNNPKYHHISLVNYKLELDELAFAVSKDFKKIDDINDTIIYLQDNGVTRNICQKYIGNLSKYCLM